MYYVNILKEYIIITKAITKMHTYYAYLLSEIVNIL